MLSTSISRSSNLPPSWIPPSPLSGSLGLSVHHACKLTFLRRAIPPTRHVRRGRNLSWYENPSAH
jgi:hypothetical protein